MSRILEIDGPPIAYIILSGIRFPYVTIGYISKDPISLIEKFSSDLEFIKEELIYRFSRITGERVIFWRKRPSIEIEGDFNCLIQDSARYKLTARLLTWPVLDERFWQRIEIKEGESLREI